MYCEPTHAEVVYSRYPRFDSRVTTIEGYTLEWTCDMATNNWGYCEVSS